MLRRAAVGGAGLFLLGGADRAALGALDAGKTLAARSATPASKVRSFRSRPDLRPPTVTVTHPAAGTAEGYLFIAPSSGPGLRGTMILDETGEPVWWHPIQHKTAMNFRPGVYKGEPVLTWWEGDTEKGLGRGTHVIVDRSYSEVARFPAGNGLHADLHELLLTSRDTALVTAYEIVTMDLTSLGGKAQHPVVNAVVQELEIPSARVLFEWRSLDHVPIAESHASVGPQYDYFHVNSIDVAPSGDLLVSARNTWAAYKVSRKTGEVVWRLGGKKTDFAMGPGTIFAWQHDARFHDGGRLVSIFDDGAAPPVQPQSKGIVLALDGKRMRATLVHKYVHRPGRLLAHFMGNTQLLPNGNVMVGWGSEPYLTEFAADGSMRFDAKLPKGGQNYRAFRFPWVGRPGTRPTLAAGSTAAGRALFASWNGATEVVSWQVLAGSRAGALTPSVTRARSGFETTLPVPTGSRYAAVTALDKDGKPLGSSKAIRV